MAILFVASCQISDFARSMTGWPFFTLLAHIEGDKPLRFFFANYRENETLALSQCAQVKAISVCRDKVAQNFGSLGPPSTRLISASVSLFQ